MVNRLFRENPNPSQKILMVKKLFKNVRVQILHLNIKNSPWCNVNFVSDFTALNNKKKQKKINVTLYGENFY